MCTELERPLEMAKFHAEPSERREGVDDEPAAVTRAVIALLGVRSHLNRTVDADWVADPFLFPLRVGGSSLRAGCGFAKGTPG